MFDAEVHEAFKAHAIAEFPKEACGLIVQFETGCKYVACENVAAEPEKDFEISGAEQVRWREQGEIVGVLHSHTNGNVHPTKADMEAQDAADIPFGIGLATEGHCTEPFYFGDCCPIPELIGRTFKNGVTDCYSLVRDWFRINKNITLPLVPRDHKWWLDGETLYLDYLQQVGFKPIRERDVEPGDCVLMQIHSKTPNHAGVYLGNGLILHHVETDLSKREPVERFRDLIYSWVRYDPETHNA